MEADYPGTFQRSTLLSSRSTLISGVYGVSLGTDIRREKRPFPGDFYFPRYLDEAGYYTTNNAKQDYNNAKHLIMYGTNPAESQLHQKARQIDAMLCSIQQPASHALSVVCCCGCVFTDYRLTNNFELEIQCWASRRLFFIG